MKTAFHSTNEQQIHRFGNWFKFDPNEIFSITNVLHTNVLLTAEPLRLRRRPCGLSDCDVITVVGQDAAEPDLAASEKCIRTEMIRLLFFKTCLDRLRFQNNVLNNVL